MAKNCLLLLGFFGLFGFFGFFSLASTSANEKTSTWKPSSLLREIKQNTTESNNMIALPFEKVFVGG